MDDQKKTDHMVSSAAAFAVLLCVLILIHIQKQPTPRTKEFFGLAGGEAHLSRGEWTPREVLAYSELNYSEYEEDLPYALFEHQSGGRVLLTPIEWNPLDSNEPGGFSYKPSGTASEYVIGADTEIWMLSGEYRYQISSADWQRLLKEETELPFRYREADGKLQMIMEQYLP